MFQQLPIEVNIEPLKEALEIHKYLFGELDWRRGDGSPHVEMRDIWLRYNDMKNHKGADTLVDFNKEHDAVWYPLLNRLPEAINPVFDVMRQVNGERLGMVLITKLPAGGKIYPHVDEGWHADYYDKYYIPVQNEEGASFYFNNGVIDSPKEGSVWWFENSEPHWVVNDSDIERIAMIVCIKTNNKLGGA